MARGKAATIGDTRTAQNGYHYTRTADGWRLTHHIIAEERILGRPLKEDERVVFIGDRKDLRPDNLKVIEKGKASIRRRIAALEARKAEIQAELDLLRKDLESTE